MIRITVNVSQDDNVLREDCVSYKPNEEAIWDTVLSAMKKYEDKEYLKHVVGHSWVPSSMDRTLTKADKLVGTVTWYVKVYIK